MHGSEYSGILINFCVIESVIVLVIASVINDSGSCVTLMTVGWTKVVTLFQIDINLNLIIMCCFLYQF